MNKKIQNESNSNEYKRNDSPENVVVYKKPVSNSNNIEKKDPMVWDPPEDKVNNKSNSVLYFNF